MSTARRLTWWIGALVAAAASLALPVTGDAAIVLAILVFAMIMWVSETIPLAVTALLASLLLILVAGRDRTTVFAAYFDPVIVLLLGGFFLGVGLSKHGLDRVLAAAMARRAGARPSLVLLAIMVTTAGFSMWISNTASTAIMLPIALGIVAADPHGRDNLARNMVLGVAFSANIGGIATPIGTPANPIALRFLTDAGAEITFLGWMSRAAPLALVMIVAAWFILQRVYPLGDAPLEPPPAGAQGFTRAQGLLLATFLLTVTLWLTTDLHGVSAAVVAVVPIVLLALLGLVDEADIHKVGWPTLLLIGGGLALGDAVVGSGLDGIFGGVVADLVGDRGGFVAFLAVATAGLVMTVFSSNTAAAVIMIPIVITLATAWGIPLAGISMLAAVVLSLDFLVPVGTPPNAMAYGTGHVNVRQMAQAGALISVAGVLLASTAAWLFW